jgi:hypothetical protein
MLRIDSILISLFVEFSITVQDQKNGFKFFFENQDMLLFIFEKALWNKHGFSDFLEHFYSRLRKFIAVQICQNIQVKVKNIT